MPSPFPGMDPFLESPEVYPDFHQALALAIRTALAPRLRPRYVARVYARLVTDFVEPHEVRVLVPDVTVIRQQRIEIRAAGSRELVTVIEIVSLANKRPGSQDGLAYARKREEYLASSVHFIEIDLLRAHGRWSPPRTPVSHYRLLLSRATRRDRASVWPVTLRQRLPTVPVPLRAPDPDVPLDLQAAFDDAYEGAAYDVDLDYTGSVPPPPLPSTEAKWVKARVRRARLA
jgi:hypothetical protein